MLNAIAGRGASALTCSVAAVAQTGSRTYVACASASLARTSGLLQNVESRTQGVTSQALVSARVASPVPGFGRNVWATQPSRTFIGDLVNRLTSGANAKKQETIEKKRAEVFQWQLDQLSSMETFNLASHKTMLEQSADKMGLNDWRAKLRTKAQQVEIDEAWLDLKISQRLTPEELGDPGLIHRREKLRIAQEAGTEVSKVTQFLNNFEQVKGMHKWIASRKSRALPIPTTLEDFQAAMVSDRQGINKEMQQPTRYKPRSTRGMLLKQFRQ